MVTAEGLRARGAPSSSPRNACSAASRRISAAAFGGLSALAIQSRGDDKASLIIIMAIVAADAAVLLPLPFFSFSPCAAAHRRMPVPVASHDLCACIQ